MKIDDALEKGRGYARKDINGNRYRVEKIGEAYRVTLRHRSGKTKELDSILYECDFTRKYGASGWEPGM